MITSSFKWGNYKLPTEQELELIKNFGQYSNFDPDQGNFKNRLSIEIANLKEASLIVIYHHYLHRGRTMAQLPYWILVDNIRVGVLLYSLPRLSNNIEGIGPMNLLELARVWIHKDLQGKSITDSSGKTHTVPILSLAISQSIKRARQDWAKKYPKLPDILAIISWADDEHHEGIIYKACNFRTVGKSGGSLHGNHVRPTGGKNQLNRDYKHIKTKFLFEFKSTISNQINEVTIDQTELVL